MSSVKRSQNVKGFVRVRPFTKLEKPYQDKNTFQIVNQKEIIVKLQHEKKYITDGVFSSNHTQKDVFESIGFPMLRDVLAGYSCALLACGQSGSGKTYTMSNIGSPNETNFDVTVNESGMVPLFFKALFDELQLHRTEYTLSISNFIIHNEEVHDLLTIRAVQDTSVKVRLYDDNKCKGSIKINGIEKSTVTSNAQVVDLLKKAHNRKKEIEKVLNIPCNKAHTLLIAKLQIREVNEKGVDVIKVGKMTFVDLASSDNDSKSNVNKKSGSVNALSRVVTALNEKMSYVPFRDSKLTRILQDCLAGHGITSFISTLNPFSTNKEEPMNTLDFISKVRNIVNQPECNKPLTKETLVQHYKDEMKKLRKELEAAYSGKTIYIGEDRYKEIQAEIEANKDSVSGCIQLKRDIEQRIKELDKEFDDILELFNKTEGDKQKEISKHATLTEQTKLIKAEVDINKENTSKIYLKERYVHQQAEVILKATEATIGSENILHEKLSILHNAAKKNEDLLNIYMTNMFSKFKYYEDKFVDYLKICNKFYSHLISSNDEYTANFMGKYKCLKDKIIDLDNKCIDIMNNVNNPKSSAFERCSESRAAQLKCLQDLIEFQATIKNIWNEPVHELLCKEKENNAKTIAEITLFKQTMLECFDRLIGDMLRLTEEFKQTFVVLLNLFIQNETSLMSSKRLQMEKQRKIQDKFNKIAELFKEVKDINESCFESIDVTIAETSSTLTAINKSSNYSLLTKQLNEITRQETCIMDAVSKKVVDIQTIVENQEKENSVNKEIFNNLIKSNGQCISEVKSISLARIYENKTYLENIVNESETEAKECVEKLTATFNENMENVKSSLEEIYKDEIDVRKSYEQYQEAAVVDMQNFTTEISSLQKEIVTSIQQFRNTNEDVKAMYINISHKGDTPVRKPKSFPNKINVNTPKRLTSMIEEDS